MPARDSVVENRSGPIAYPGLAQHHPWGRADRALKNERRAAMPLLHFRVWNNIFISENSKSSHFEQKI